MKTSMHFNESIPIAITHVKENRTSENRGIRVMCGHDDHVGCIYKFITMRNRLDLLKTL